MDKIELIVRGLIVNKGKILLCKNLSEGHYFLPGGHIENNESPEDALKRELTEEIGRISTKSKKIAEVENSYTSNGKNRKEIFYVYFATLDNYDNIISKESHLDFEWIPTEQLSAINFKPQKVIPDIIEAVKNVKFL